MSASEHDMSEDDEGVVVVSDESSGEPWAKVQKTGPQAEYLCKIARERCEHRAKLLGSKSSTSEVPGSDMNAK